MADPLQIEVGVASYYSASDLAAIAREAESWGIERFWIAENYYWRSAIPLAALASQATSEIGIGLGVLNWFTRSGPLLAMEAATLDEISGGRLTLGIGAGRTPATDLNMEGRRVIPGLRAAVEICRQMLLPNVVGRDEERDEGRVRSLSLDFEPIRPSIPTYLAGMGPKTLQLAGEIADGAFLDVLTGPEFVREAVEFVSTGLDKSGRRIEDVFFGAYVLFAVDEDREVARRLVKAVLVDYLLHRMVADRRLSAAGIEPEEFAELRDGLRGAWLRGGTQAAVDYLPGLVCDRLSVCGTPDECIARLDELRSAGLGTAVLFNVFGKTPLDGLALIATRVVPAFRA